MSEKSKTTAMILSFLFTGMGFVYLGNNKKGLGLFAIGVICNLIGMFILGFFHYLSILTWIISLYLTYKEPVKSANAYTNEIPTSRRHVESRSAANRRPADARHIENRRYSDERRTERVHEDRRYSDDRRAERVHEDRRYSEDIQSKPIDERKYFNRSYRKVNDQFHERVPEERRHSKIHYEGMSYDNEVPVTRDYTSEIPDDRKLRDIKDDDLLKRRRIR